MGYLIQDYYTDGENAKLTCGLGDNGCCPGTGTAAHTGSNEHHVCAGQMITDHIDCFFRCGAPTSGCEPAPSLRSPGFPSG